MVSRLLSSHSTMSMNSPRIRSNRAMYVSRQSCTSGAPYQRDMSCQRATHGCLPTFDGEFVVRDFGRGGILRRVRGVGERARVLLGGVGKQREAQLAYSEFQSAMLDEEKRRRKAAKIIAVLEHFHGPLSGLTVADVGCSAGFIADELAGAGAKHTLGIDIDVPGLRKAADRFGE